MPVAFAAGEPCSHGFVGTTTKYVFYRRDRTGRCEVCRARVPEVMPAESVLAAYREEARITGTDWDAERVERLQWLQQEKSPPEAADRTREVAD